MGAPGAPGGDGNSFGCSVNDSLIRQTADAMVSSGMAAAVAAPVVRSTRYALG